MKASGSTPGRRRFWKYLLWTAAGTVLLLSALAWYATTDSFQVQVRHRVVTELERITGGRVELGGFHTVPFRFLVDVRNLTIHGREAPGEVPYVHVDRLVAEVKLIAVLGAEFGFHSVVLDHPVVHIILYPDGTTNQPGPQLNAISMGDSIQRLFSLSINHLEIRRGELQWNDRKIPLDFVANDVSANMAYSTLHRHYEGDLWLGKIETQVQDFRPVSWALETHFAFNRDGFELKSLKADAGRSHLQLSGRLVDFGQPSVVGQYDATVDLLEAGAILHHPEVRHGVLQATGNGSWGGVQFSSTGNLAVRDLEWRDEFLNLHAASLGTQFTINPQRVWLSNVSGKLLGGQVNGDAEVINWLPWLPANKKVQPKTPNAQKGTVRLRFKDLSAQEIATALSSSARPLLHMNLAGAASGTVETHWKGTPHEAETSITLDVAAPPQPSRGQLPLDAHARAVYRNFAGELEVSELNAATRATQVHATGTLSTHAALKLSINTSDLGEWEPVLTSLG